MDHVVNPASAMASALDLVEMSQADALALDILSQARNTLLLHLRYMGIAIGRLELQPMSGIPLATEGTHIYFDAQHVFAVYRSEPEALARDYLHGVLHCVFSHPFVSQDIDHGLWDLACDIAVEHAINGLGLDRLATQRQSLQAGLIAGLPETVRPLTAEKIYRWLCDGDADTLELRAAFTSDDHRLWYIDPEPNRRSGGEGEGEKHQSESRKKLEQAWKDVGKNIQVDAETISHRQEGGAGTIVQNLREVTRERHDYAAFLRRFAVFEEELRTNPDEFDYVFYTYGLRLYRNLPLIEPLEYQEVRRIKEFVVAIDTSGSVSGELVQQFVQKTYNILKQSESFASAVHLRIIQCDAEIREDVKITCQEEFDAYLNAMTLRGFGGTDFRPVFEHVDRLVEKGELTNLGGLIYFTDGYGVFPQSMPRYETAFVFVEEDAQSVPKVPVWAIRLVLRPEEI